MLGSSAALIFFLWFVKKWTKRGCGILSALLIEMTFTPACRAMLPTPRGCEVHREKEGRILPTVLEAIAEIVVARPRHALLVAAAVVAVTLRRNRQQGDALRHWPLPSVCVSDTCLRPRLP